jgi:multidrug resistance protein, MATE family
MAEHAHRISRGDKVNFLRNELKPMLRLASPIVLAELGWSGMAVVDTMMVGRLPASADAMGAVSLGSILFYSVGIFGTGLMLGLDTLVSNSYGAGKMEDCHRSLVNGVYLSFAAAPVLMGAVWLLGRVLPHVGIGTVLLNLALPYMHALNWSMFPLLLYFVFRRYLQGIDQPAPVMFVLLSANLVNVLGNWVFIFGHFGAPAMGPTGSGVATSISRLYMAGVLLGFIFYHDHRNKLGLRSASVHPNFDRISRLARLGLPAASQWTVEVSVFAIATSLIGKLGAVPLASHQIAINLASLTYMVPLGIGAAAAVRVGQALGRKDPEGAKHSGWTGIVLGGAFMCCMAIVFWTVPRPIVRLFTPASDVIAMAAKLLFVAAYFQIFDGLQTVATGALRGMGDTHTALFCHLLAYWLVGLPLGYYLCFSRGMGATGIWAGLSVALIFIGIALMYFWSRKVRVLMAGT